MGDAALQRPLAMAVWRRHPAALCALLVMLAAALSVHGLRLLLPIDLWGRAIWAPDAGDIRQILVHDTWLPRLVMAWLCGGALALAGTVFQQLLRNPLASPTTLGVSAGAQLSLAAATLWAPWLLDDGREEVALLGAVLATLLVFGLAWRRALSPLALILGGLVVSLYCGAAGTALQLVYEPYLHAVFIWGAGSLVQQDWSSVTYLLPRVVGVTIMLGLIVKPLTVLGLDDETAQSLGLSLRGVRLFAIILAVALTTFVVSAVGVIGFIGLAAPAMAQSAGARRLRDRIVWAPVIGAALLWLTDQIVLWLGGVHGELIPTGAATALLGGPLLLWLLPRLRFSGQTARANGGLASPRLSSPWPMIAGGVAALGLSIVTALSFGHGPRGWVWLDFAAMKPLLVWRAPRVGAALAAGAMLACAGTLIQRLTRNPMASPEILGVGAGAIIGLIGFLFIAPGFSHALQIIAAALGAGLTLLATMALGRRGSFAPERLLLAGIAVNALFQALVAIIMASGDPRRGVLLVLMTGSTYFVTPADALVVGALAIALLSATPLFVRWLEVLPLGEPTARALGVDLGASRLSILLFSAALTATATLIVGPLSFVGLMAPHLARLMGLSRAWPQLIGASLLGALIMVAADWLGRNLFFPRDMPAGLIASLLGGPYLMFLLSRRSI